MKLVLALLLFFATVDPYVVQCPLDNEWASATGKTRITDARTECEYSHVHFVYENEKVRDDVHTFWVSCTVIAEKP